MKYAFAILLSCVAVLATAIPVFKSYHCGEVHGSECPEHASTVSCSNTRCYVVSASIPTNDHIYSIAQADFPIVNDTWIEHKYDQRIYPQFLFSLYAPKTSDALFAGGWAPGEPNDDAVIFSPNALTDSFRTVAGTPGRIQVVAPIPGTSGNVGAFFTKKIDGKNISGVYIMSAKGMLINTITFSGLDSLKLTDIAFATETTWLVAGSISDKDSLILQTNDGGSQWDIALSIMNDASLLARVACTASSCFAAAHDGANDGINKATVFYADLVPGVTATKWESGHIPFSSALFYVTKLAISADGKRAIMSGFTHSDTHMEKSRAFQATYRGDGNFRFVDFVHTYAKSFGGIEFYRDNWAFMIGRGHGGVYTFVEER